MEVFALHEGTYSVDSSKMFRPFDSNVHTIRERPGAMLMSIQPFLVKTVADLIVIDTGLGHYTDQGELMLHHNIRRMGYQPEEVSLVLMSHLHVDHAGGMMYKTGEQTQLAFPNARYVVQHGEWDMACHSPLRSYNAENFPLLQESGCLHLVEGSGIVNEHIHYELTGGHCKFHQVFLIQEHGEKLFFGGDILPEPEQLFYKFTAKYDLDGQKTMELRQEYGKRAAAEGWTCLFYHAKSKDIAKLRYEGNHFSLA